MNTKIRTTAFIMAGGKGERFWPRSRVACPKQFLDILGCGKTMLQLTVERILPLTSMEGIYIATNERYRQLVEQQLPLLPPQNILCEPVGRNTAPCIGLGAEYILKGGEDAVMMVLASDHLIRQVETYRKVMREAVEIAAEEENIVTIGISPNYPETGYGYIRRDMEAPYRSAYRVEEFVEKPNRRTAEAYLRSGEYLWNSGMFVMKASTVQKAMQDYLPEVAEGLGRIGAAIGTDREREVLREAFSAMPSVSIDYGILEKAKNIYALAGAFGWDDVGSWLAMERYKSVDDDNNILVGNVVSADTRNCIVEAKDRLIALVGLDGVVVVDTEDATLIGGKEHIEEVKKLLKLLREKEEGERYL